MPLNHKSAAVREMRELLKSMLTDPDFEHRTCERIDVVDLLDAARRYNPDRIGIEVVEIALNALSTQLRAVCTNNTYTILRMRKISYAGEHTMMSTYAWFKDSKPTRVPAHLSNNPRIIYSLPLKKNQRRRTAA